MRMPIYDASSDIDHVVFHDFSRRLINRITKSNRLGPSLAKTEFIKQWNTAVKNKNQKKLKVLFYNESLVDEISDDE